VDTPVRGPAGIAGYPSLAANNPVDGTGRITIDWYAGSTANLKFGPLAGSVSVITRSFHPVSVDGTVGTFFSTVDGTSKGFAYYYANGGFPTEGLVMIVYDSAGNPFFVHTGSRANYRGELQHGARYNATNSTIDLWLRGAKIATGTDSSHTWNPGSTGYAQTGSWHGQSFWWAGSLFWLAVFDRALSDAEMTAWTTLDPYDLILPKDGMMKPPLSLWNINNTVQVDQEFIGDNPYNLSTTLHAGASTGGDIPSVGGIGFTPLNEVRVDQTLFTVLTIPIATQNVIAIDQSLTLTNNWNLANQVGVGNSIELTISDQPGLLLGDRYKR